MPRERSVARHARFPELWNRRSDVPMAAKRKQSSVPWNKDKLVGQKAPLKLRESWAIRKVRCATLESKSMTPSRSRSKRNREWPLSARSGHRRLRYILDVSAFKAPRMLQLARSRPLQLSIVR